MKTIICMLAMVGLISCSGGYPYPAECEVMIDDVLCIAPHNTEVDYAVLSSSLMWLEDEISDYSGKDLNIIKQLGKHKVTIYFLTPDEYDVLLATSVNMVMVTTNGKYTEIYVKNPGGCAISTYRADTGLMHFIAKFHMDFRGSAEYLPGYFDDYVSDSVNRVIADKILDTCK